MKFSGILIGTDDPGRLTKFYEGLFGEPTWTDESYTGWMIGTSAVTVGAHDHGKGENADPARVIWNLESDDVRGDFEKFRAAGATVIAEPYTLSDENQEMTIATLADPDGNYFQLMSPM